MTETIHARPPILPPEIYQAVAASAEQHPAAKLIAIHDPVANATLAGQGTVKLEVVRVCKRSEFEHFPCVLVGAYLRSYFRVFRN